MEWILLAAGLITTPATAEQFDLTCTGVVSRSDGDPLPAVGTKVMEVYHVDTDKMLVCEGACRSVAQIEKITASQLNLCVDQPIRQCVLISRLDGKMIGGGAVRSADGRVLGYDTDGVCTRGPITIAPKGAI